MSAKAAFIKDGELSAKIAVQQFLGDRQNPCALSFPVASTTTGKDHEAKSEAFPQRGDSSKVITCAASPPRRPMLRERGSVREKPTDREPAYPRGGRNGPPVGPGVLRRTPRPGTCRHRGRLTSLSKLEGEGNRPSRGSRLSRGPRRRTARRGTTGSGQRRGAAGLRGRNVAAACPRATVTAVGSSRGGQDYGTPILPGGASQLLSARRGAAQ